MSRYPAPLFRCRIPYDQADAIDGLTVQPGSLTPRRDRQGTLRVPIYSGDRNTIVGKLVHLSDGAAGCDLVVDLGAPSAQPDNYRQGGYYVRPAFAAGQWIALEVLAVETWPAAYLRPSSSAPAAGSPLPARPAVNLAPIVRPR